MFINIKSLNILSITGLILIILFISTFPAPILCQNKKTAIVSFNSQSGKFDISSLEQITFFLNSEIDINDVIILYKSTPFETPEKLNQLYKSNDRLNASYHLICGNNNFSGQLVESSFGSEGYDGDEFILNKNDKLFLGLNCVIQNNSETGFINIELLNKIKELPNLNTINTVLVFSNFKSNRIQNLNALTDLLPGKSFIFFSPSLIGFSSGLNEVNNIFEIEIPTSMSDSPNYFLIEERQDSLLIRSKSILDSKSEIKTRIRLKNIKAITKSIPSIIVDSSLTLVNQIDFGTTSTIPLVATDNKIITTLNNGLIYSNDFTGNEKFVSELMGNIITNPVYYKDLILIPTNQGDLYSLNSNNGEVLQVVGIGENITSDLSLIDINTKNIISKAAVFGTINGNIFCYDAFTFELLWKNNISTMPIVSKPFVDNEKIVFLNSASSLYCVNSKSGALIWRYEFNDKQDFSSKYLPLCDGKSVFSISPGENLFAIDLLSGKIIWSINLQGILNRLFFSPDNSEMITMNSNGLITFTASKSGKKVWEFDLKKSDLFSFIITENKGYMFIGLSDGSLYSIDSKYNFKELISQTNIPITSVNLIDKNGLIVKDVNGKISFYKTR